jgi:GNAT superfamily N-acetyltransferase
MDIEIVAPADAAAVADVLRRVHGVDFEAALERELEQILSDGVTVAIVARVDDDNAGCILVHSRRTAGLLHSLAVVDEHRRRGLATALIEAAVTRFRDTAPDELLVAAVDPNGVWVRERFEDRGFVAIHRRPVKGYHILIQGAVALAASA